MDTLKLYSLAFKGLKQGHHKLEYSLDKTFFDNFEHSAIHESNIQVIINIEVSHRLLDFNYIVEGFHKSDCDRCLKNIQPEIKGEFRYLVKIVDDISENMENDDEVAYISTKESFYNYAKDMYDFIHLSMPLRNVCENETECDLRVQELLNNYHQQSQTNDSRWEKLNILKQDKN